MRRHEQYEQYEQYDDEDLSRTDRVDLAAADEVRDVRFAPGPGASTVTTGVIANRNRRVLGRTDDGAT